MGYTYIENIKKLIEIVETNEDENIKKCIDMFVETIKNKKSIYIFGASHAGILSEELYYRAGGLVLVNPIFARELMLDNSPITFTSEMERCLGYGDRLAKKVGFNKDDLLILHSVSGRNPVTIEMAMYAQSVGCKIIGITNLSYSKNVSSRHPINKNMYEFCDVVLDNHGDIGDACVEIEGMKQKVSPTSTIIGALMLNTIVSEVAKKLVEEGVDNPPIFYSANIDGGDKLNRELFEKYKEEIHYKY